MIRDRKKKISVKTSNLIIVLFIISSIKIFLSSSPDLQDVSDPREASGFL
jgi:hypothetical protein